jgi:hypothetical protein
MSEIIKVELSGDARSNVVDAMEFLQLKTPQFTNIQLVKKHYCQISPVPLTASVISETSDF